jgi:hypothetical protein
MPKPRDNPTVGTRLLLFVFVALPGAYGVAMGGIMLGFALFGPSGTGTLEAVPLLIWILVVASPFLLLIGLGVSRRPLYLLVFVPMPLLMAASYYLREYRDHRQGWIAFLGLAAPFIAYPMIAIYYRRRFGRKPHISSAPEFR